MPRDVAVQRPHTRIIGVVLNDEMGRGGGGAGLDKLHIAALRIGDVGNNAVPYAGAFG